MTLVAWCGVLTGCGPIAAGVVAAASGGGGGDGAGSLAPPLVLVESDQQFGLEQLDDVAVGDVDGDGDPDVVIADEGQLEVWLNDGEGVFSALPAQVLPFLPRRLLLGDLDGDRDLDLVTATGVFVLLNDGSGVFSPQPDPVVGDEVRCLALGDMDLDDDLDIVVGDGSLTTVSVYLNDGVGGFSLYYRQQRQAEPAGIYLVDVDDDDLPEVVTGGRTGAVGAPLVIYRNLGTGDLDVGTRIGDDGSGNDTANSLAFADFDRDGDVDIMVAGPFSTYVLPNDGLGSFGPRRGGLPLAAMSLTLGDLDRDGDLDLVATVRLGGVAAVYLNQGAAGFAFSSTVPGTRPRSLLAVLLHDVDGDRHPDVVRLYDDFGAPGSLRIFRNLGLRR